MWYYMGIYNPVSSLLRHHLLEPALDVLMEAGRYEALVNFLFPPPCENWD